MTGLAAGLATGFTVYEAGTYPGGICASYYIKAGCRQRLLKPPRDREAYRFEVGGGHWIFGADTESMKFIQELVSVKKYVRRASVFFSGQGLYVPYPLQNNLRLLDKNLVQRALREMSSGSRDVTTMKEWLESSFGPSLCELFFNPFHKLYTSNLYERIAPQDAQKSPINRALVIQGAKSETPPEGYNVTFVYPKDGLNSLIEKMSHKADVRYGKRVMKINVNDKEILFSDGCSLRYENLISTLPLNRIMELSGLTAEGEPFPYTSVLVLNIGARRGHQCPDDHWIYTPDAKSGFHRVGFYSNVEKSFLPKSSRRTNCHVSLYVERSYVGGAKPSDQSIGHYAQEVVRELREWGFIGEVEVLDTTWIDVAYTWAWPDSHWKESAVQNLREHNIYPIGRYGRWTFQGILDSVKEGLDCLQTL